MAFPRRLSDRLPWYFPRRLWPISNWVRLQWCLVIVAVGCTNAYAAYVVFSSYLRVVNQLVQAGSQRIQITFQRIYIAESNVVCTNMLPRASTHRLWCSARLYLCLLRMVFSSYVFFISFRFLLLAWIPAVHRTTGTPYLPPLPNSCPIRLPCRPPIPGKPAKYRHRKPSP